MTTVQRTYPVVIVTFLVIFCGLLAGCASTSSPENTASPEPHSTSSTTTIERVEVFHFYGNRQCASCIAVGDLAERTVNASFKNDLILGRLVFAHVNYDLPENAALKTKYNVTGSSLWIGVYDANGFSREEDIRVWTLINDEETYSRYLTGLITKRLNGDLS
ncbi:MAG: hypothetical protein EHM53_05045 [Methanoregulaceae archaeon]|nr:MAG: hypothetical protein EHM53_05045 [Methanoregulaceae archaeon]